MTKKQELQKIISTLEASSLLIFKSEQGGKSVEFQIGDPSDPEAVRESIKRFKSEIIYFLKKEVKDGAN